MRTYYSYFIGAAIAIAIAIIVYLSLRQCEHFQQSSIHLNIMDAQQTAEWLSNDPDNYVEGMSSYDLIARGANSYTDYLKRISAAAHEATKWESDVIANAVAVVDKYIKQDKKKLLSPYIADIPWNIAITQGRDYEDGFPHTRKNVIFINDSLIKSSALASTLLHEKIHVFQRMYPAEMDAWIAKRGFKKWKTRKSEPLSRANPDLDEWIYIDPKTQRPMIAVYSSEVPKGISDVKLANPAFEHPYELMAYEAAEAFNAA